MPKQELGEGRSLASLCTNAIFFIFFVVLSDQLAKYMVVTHVGLQEIIGSRYFNVTYYKNTGIAFGIPFPEGLLLGLIITLLVVLVWYYRKSRSVVVFLSLSLIIGGALSNLIDRIFRGAVIDYISVFVWPTFNLADVSITLGVLILALHEFGKRDK